VENLEEELAAAVSELRSYLSWAGEGGPVMVSLPPTPAPISPSPSPSTSIPMGKLPIVSLDDVRARMGECTLCKLHKGRHTIVFGVGNPEARLMFMGEAPGEDEDLKGEPFLKGQLASVKPEVIVTLGKFAAQALLREQMPITRLRGQWREYEGIPVMPTFHPAYLLRSPQEKTKVWEDLQSVMKKLSLERKR